MPLGHKIDPLNKFTNRLDLIIIATTYMSVCGVICLFCLLWAIKNSCIKNLLLKFKIRRFLPYFGFTCHTWCKFPFENDQFWLKYIKIAKKADIRAVADEYGQYNRVSLLLMISTSEPSTLLVRKLLVCFNLIIMRVIAFWKGHTSLSLIYPLFELP